MGIQDVQRRGGPRPRGSGCRSALLLCAAAATLAALGASADFSLPGWRWATAGLRGGSEKGVASSRSPRVSRRSSPPKWDSDWRDFRASLIARERRQNGADTEVGGARPNNWAYSSPLIEQGSVLLSEPGCGFSFQQQYFQKAVILLVDHRENCDMGIILNRPTAVSTSQLGIPGPDWLMSFGGDCQGLKDTPRSRLDSMCAFCLHHRADLAPVSKEIVSGLYFTNLPQAQASVGKGDADVDDFLMVAGYCGWGRGQLQRELDAGGFWSLAAVDKQSLVRELRQAQARAALESAADKVEVDDGTAAWRRMYDTLGREYEDRANAWLPDVMFGDQRLREWINANLVHLDTGACGRC